MPDVRLHTGTKAEFEMHYMVDNFVEPWRTPETILMLHGNSESSAVWYGWVPHFLRHYEVVRPDMRGFGASTAMPRDYQWTLDALVEDYVALMDTLGVHDFHLVAAKFGGTIARHFAARYPRRVRSLTLAGTPQARRTGFEANLPLLMKEVETDGMEGWARRTMGGRLGSKFDPDGVDWWIAHMGRTAPSTQLGFLASGVQVTDVTGDLPLITCPTLVLVTEGSALGSIAETRQWQAQIPNSILVVLPGNSYHVAASDADQCALETLNFIQKTNSGIRQVGVLGERLGRTFGER